MKQSELLKFAIEKAGSKKELAKLTGFRLANIYEWEKGLYSMKFDVMIDLLDAVGLKLELVEKNKTFLK